MQKQSAPKSDAATAKLINGRRHLTLGDRYVYLLDTATDTYMLPLVRTDREERYVREAIAKLGATQPDGARVVVDGAAWLGAIPWQFGGKRVVLAVALRRSGGRHLRIARI